MGALFDTELLALPLYPTEIKHQGGAPDFTMHTSKVNALFVGLPHLCPLWVMAC